MRRSIDIKSALIGGLLAALILCLAGGVPYMHWEEYGRFQIETNDSHAFILDSATGQAWSTQAHIPNEERAYYATDPNFHAPKALPLPRTGELPR